MEVQANSGRAARHAPAVRDQATHSPVQEAMLPVASVAKRLGVAPSTLRTWDRRYGLGPTRHIGGRHRRYGVADIGRLELMQRALLRGASTAEAARYALQRMPKSPASSAEAATQPLGSYPDVPAAAGPLRIETPDGQVIVPAEGADGRAGGDEFGAARFARSLGALARSMDVAGVRVALEESITVLGVARAWEEVYAPVLEALYGEGSASGDTPVRGDAACLLHECVLAALIRANPVLATPPNHRPVLLVALTGEPIALPVYALAAGLGVHGLVAQPLGSTLPAPVLATAVRRAAPAAVVLWATGPEVADPGLFARLSRARQPRRLFAGGPGWDPESLPPTVEALAGVPGALDRLVYVAG